jgi:hypothetical protein
MATTILVVCTRTHASMPECRIDGGNRLAVPKQEVLLLGRGKCQLGDSQKNAKLERGGKKK